MPDYLARLTVRDVPDDETCAGMCDALGAVTDDSPDAPWDGPLAVTFDVPGEAPDHPTAVSAAERHAAEVLDDFDWEVTVDEQA